MQALAKEIKQRASALGFCRAGICHVELGVHEKHLLDWLCKGYHASMRYMLKHGLKRSRPKLLDPSARRLVMVALSYAPSLRSHVQAQPEQVIVTDAQRGIVSRYARGRDYHKVLRQRLKKLISQVQPQVLHAGGRIFCDSAPFMEKALAHKAGLGWMGKHSLVLNRQQGSWFFLAGFSTNLPLPVDLPASNHCGQCSQCMNACPTGAIVQPYVVDARRCIAYWTIEHRGIVPEHMLKPIGNRIFGCDDCQLVCPWNRRAPGHQNPDFHSRHGLDEAKLLELLAWSEHDFEVRSQGMALRRISHAQWLRNIAIALGNAPFSHLIVSSLERLLQHPDPSVRHHCLRALNQQQARSS